jgi:hypothetical protein
MRIRLQMEREPFHQIFERTMQRFAADTGWGDVQVRWGNRRESSSGRLWLCNGFLNAVFLRGAHPAALVDLADLFGHSGGYWRNRIQRTYAWLCGSRLLAAALADASVVLSRDVPRQEHLVIFAGNNRLRVLDAGEGRCRVVLKDGFPARSIEREVEARRSATGVPSPRILSAASTHFCEEYVRALPLNRLPAGNARSTVEMAASRAMADWSCRHARELRADETASWLRDCIRSVLDVSSPALAPHAARFARFAARLARSVEESAGTARVLVGPSHGDFHGGNVLVTPDGYRVIDWEFACERVLGYDGFVLALEPRFPRGLTGRLGAFLRDGAASDRLQPWNNADDGSPARRQLRLDLFLLEELRFHAEVHANPQFQRLTPGVAEYIHTIERFRFGAA